MRVWGLEGEERWVWGGWRGSIGECGGMRRLKGLGVLKEFGECIERTDATTPNSQSKGRFALGRLLY